MTDAQLRQLVRDAVARHLGAAPSTPHPPSNSLAASTVPAVSSAAPLAAGGPTGHPSHYLYVALVNSGEACVIEPGVACNHCGYCRSHGH